ncbi:hypothetical protein QUC31_011701 [Theobroma cacao]
MKSPSFSMTLFLHVLFSFSWAILAHTHDSFLQCLSLHSDINARLIYTANTSSYSSVLEISVRNARFSTPTTPKPSVIVTPSNVSHIQATINCSREHDMQIRIQSGGQNYESLSYVSLIPFVIIDLINMQSIDVYTENITSIME